MKLVYRILSVLLLTISLSSCHDIKEWANDPRGNFEALWTIIDEHYCFFAEKDVDWNEVYTRYARKISDEMTREELFGVCADMVNELRDGHTNLSAPFNVSYYRAWWSNYPQNFDHRLIQQYYFNFNYRTATGLEYGILPENIGYIYYSSFSNHIGEGNLDYVLAYFAACDGLIIDVRDNGGGSMTNIETFVSRFISQRMLAGYIIHKTGAGHDDFSEPYAYYYDPASQGHIMWGKPVAVLTNRSTFSAANNFVSVMKQIPNVSIVGATTGGGSGMPYSSELPCGWAIRMSACSILDANGDVTEHGVDPSDGCTVDMDSLSALDGHDTILDFAVTLLTGS